MAQVLGSSGIALDSHYIIHWSDFRSGTYAVEQKRLKQVAYEGVERLLELQTQARLTVGVSARFRADKIQDLDQVRKTRHMDAFEALLARGAKLLPTTFRFDVGWGSWAGEEDRALQEELVRALFPKGIVPDEDRRWRNKIVDIDHLRDALRAGYGTYLTEEKRILKRSEEIAELGIRVCTISDSLREIETVPVRWTPTEGTQDTPVRLSRTSEEGR